MSEDLKGCPFCGGQATLEEVKMGDVSNWSVGCLEHDGKPLCMGYQSLTQFARKAEAVEAWNRRAPTMRDNGWLGPDLHDKAQDLIQNRRALEPPPVLGVGREEIIAALLRRAFQAGRVASKHYQTMAMTKAALDPIIADAIISLLGPRS